MVVFYHHAAWWSRLIWCRAGHAGCWPGEKVHLYRYEYNDSLNRSFILSSLSSSKHFCELLLKNSLGVNFEMLTFHKLWSFFLNFHKFAFVSSDSTLALVTEASIKWKQTESFCLWFITFCILVTCIKWWKC